MLCQYKFNRTGVCMSVEATVGMYNLHNPDDNRAYIASYPGSLFFESLVHTDYACVHFSQHSWEIVIFQYIPRFTDPAHVIENEAVS